MSESGESVERPYRLSAGEQIWERALRNHFPKLVRDDTRRYRDFQLLALRFPELHMLLMHDVIQGAAAFLDEKKEEEVTVTKIAQLLTTPSLSLDELTIRNYLRHDFSHLKEQYGISIHDHKEVREQYQQIIEGLWRKNNRRPTLRELAREFKMTPNGTWRMIDSSRWLRTLWEEGPKSEKE